MSTAPRDAPYPELKNSHTMAHTGRPWADRKPPSSAPVWAAIEGLARYYVLLAAIELDVFDTLQRTGPTTVGTLATELQASELHLGSMLDAVVALGLLDQVDDVYDLNDTARRYLVSDGPATMARLIPVAPGPHDNWVHLAETVRNGRPTSPIDNDPATFYVPLVEGTFTTMYRCAMRADLKIRYSAMAAPRVLDVGAGGAPWAIAILGHNPTATAVVNDYPQVLELATRNAVSYDVADRMELLPGDFHDVEFEREAFDIAVLSHVCRTEGAGGAADLIRRAYEALRPEGVLIVADYFQDIERKSNPHAVLMGTTMMASTLKGLTFTHKQFSEWIRAAGFEAVRLIEPIGFQQQFVSSKPRGKR